MADPQTSSGSQKETQPANLADQLAKKLEETTPKQQPEPQKPESEPEQTPKPKEPEKFDLAGLTKLFDEKIATIVASRAYKRFGADLPETLTPEWELKIRGHRDTVVKNSVSATEKIAKRKLNEEERVAVENQARKIYNQEIEKIIQNKSDTTIELGQVPDNQEEAKLKLTSLLDTLKVKPELRETITRIQQLINGELGLDIQTELEKINALTGVDPDTKEQLKKFVQIVGIYKQDETGEGEDSAKDIFDYLTEGVSDPNFLEMIERYKDWAYSGGKSKISTKQIDQDLKNLTQMIDSGIIPNGKAEEFRNSLLQIKKKSQEAPVSSKGTGDSKEGLTLDESFDYGNIPDGQDPRSARKREELLKRALEEVGVTEEERVRKQIKLIDIKNKGEDENNFIYKGFITHAISEAQKENISFINEKGEIDKNKFETWLRRWALRRFAQLTSIGKTSHGLDTPNSIYAPYHITERLGGGYPFTLEEIFRALKVQGYGQVCESLELALTNLSSNYNRMKIYEFSKSEFEKTIESLTKMGKINGISPEGLEMMLTGIGSVSLDNEGRETFSKMVFQAFRLYALMGKDKSLFGEKEEPSEKAKSLGLDIYGLSEEYLRENGFTHELELLKSYKDKANPNGFTDFNINNPFPYETQSLTQEFKDIRNKIAVLAGGGDLEMGKIAESIAYNYAVHSLRGAALDSGTKGIDSPVRLLYFNKYQIGAAKKEKPSAPGLLLQSGLFRRLSQSAWEYWKIGPELEKMSIQDALVAGREDLFEDLDESLPPNMDWVYYENHIQWSAKVNQYLVDGSGINWANLADKGFQFFKENQFVLSAEMVKNYQTMYKFVGYYVDMTDADFLHDNIDFIQLENETTIGSFPEIRAAKKKYREGRDRLREHLREQISTIPQNDTKEEKKDKRRKFEKEYRNSIKTEEKAFKDLLKKRIMYREFQSELSEFGSKRNVANQIKSLWSIDDVSPRLTLKDITLIRSLLRHSKFIDPETGQTLEASDIFSDDDVWALLVESDIINWQWLFLELLEIAIKMAREYNVKIKY